MPERFVAAEGANVVCRMYACLVQPVSGNVIFAVITLSEQFIFE
jgi:hypothetical protein